jgi:hypothetical protein
MTTKMLMVWVTAVVLHIASPVIVAEVQRIEETRR